MNTILTFFYKLLQSLLGFFTPSPSADIEEGVSVDEKKEGYEQPVRTPSFDDFIEVNLSDGNVIINPAGATTDTVEAKPARAKLLDILIQFPLPPSHKSAGLNEQPVSMWILRTWNRGRVEEACPTSTKRSSLAWFGDKNEHSDESISTDTFWVPVRRAIKTDDELEWVSSDDMAKVLKEFQEIEMHDENVRELFADMSVSTVLSSENM